MAEEMFVRLDKEMSWPRRSPTNSHSPATWTVPRPKFVSRVCRVGCSERVVLPGGRHRNEENDTASVVFYVVSTINMMVQTTGSERQSAISEDVPRPVPRPVPKLPLHYLTHRDPAVAVSEAGCNGPRQLRTRHRCCRHMLCALVGTLPITGKLKRGGVGGRGPTRGHTEPDLPYTTLHVVFRQ